MPDNRRHRAKGGCRVFTDRGGRLWIGSKQRKTKALVDMPVHARLEPLPRDRVARRIVRQDR